MRAYDGTGNRNFIIDGDESSAVVFTGRGVIVRLNVEDAVDSATITITPGGVANAYVCPAHLFGSLPIMFETHDGCSVTATGFTGGRAMLTYLKV